MENNEQFVKEQLDKHLEGYGTLDEITSREGLKKILIELNRDQLDNFLILIKQTVTINIPDSEPKIFEGVADVCEELLPKNASGAINIETMIDDSITIHVNQTTKGINELIKIMDDTFSDLDKNHNLKNKSKYPTIKDWFKTQLETINKKKSIKELIQVKDHYEINNNKMKENLLSVLA